MHLNLFLGFKQLPNGYQPIESKQFTTNVIITIITDNFI